MNNYNFYKKKLYLDKNVFNELCNMKIKPLELERERMRLMETGHPHPTYNTAASIIIARRKNAGVL